MSEKKQSYLQQQLEAIITKEDGYTFSFQKEKIKLDHAVEMDMVKEMDPSIQRDIILSDDELKIVVKPPESYLSFLHIKKKNMHSKYLLAYQLVKQVKDFSFSRLHLCVCPENIVFDQSLTPYFLHYGVKESLPPYEKDADRLWIELKATVAAAIDHKYTFHQYLNFHETLELTPLSKEVLSAETEEELLHLLEEKIVQLEESEKSLIHIPQKKWKLTRYIALGFLICLIPALIYTIYSMFILQPKQEAFVASNEQFLGSDYSEVVNTLSNYGVEEMPNVVKFQLASAFIVNESLTEEQKENVRNTITLQSDPRYFDYWIHIGRGTAKDALDIARSLEDRDLIMFGLLKYEEEIKSDESLSSEEKQKQLEEVESEIEQYQEEKEAQREEEQQQEDEQQAREQVEQQQPAEQKNDQQPAKDQNQPADQKEASEEQPKEKSAN
ncbi:type VII secretion protein EssB [Metabacillus arenae]|uniref:Type VII secretion protein EssB n=1 Tax=Metabacillus arenae TaxID=2771434 RepID=A0A926RX44_9BACI|nr:type VII secretion protein EssB [Metabacillus arenae]MBD1379772.1 type VII secretion protein EssB [Metabacillus arenae]